MLYKKMKWVILAGIVVSVFGWGIATAEKESEVDSSLIGFWHFDEGEGEIARDSSRKGNDGTIHGATWVTEGISGSSLSFDGGDDYVDCGYNSDSMDFHAFTVEVWIKPNELGEPQGIVTRGWRHPWGLFIDETNRLRMPITFADDTHLGGRTSASVLTPGRWYHIAVTFDSTDGNIIFYIDGKMDKRYSLVALETKIFDIPVHIGNIFYEDESHSTAWFNGLIDEVRIYNRVLSIEEIKEHYKSEKGKISKAIPVAEKKTTPVAWKKIASVSRKKKKGMYLFKGGKEEITYLAEDEIGDFKVFIDGTRMLRVSWKGIELLNQWGEIWNPVEASWRGGEHLYRFPNDILVKVRRNKDRVEYRWGDNISSSGFRQINRVVVTPKKIICDSSLEFTKNPPGSIRFSPVLFPGEEGKIKGKECLVKKSNGEAFKLVYPKEEKSSFPWIKATDTEELLFLLDEGRVRYSFSTLQRPFSLSFTGYSRSISNEHQRGIVGSLRLRPEGVPYKETVHLEIAVEEGAKEEVEGIKEVDFGDDLLLSIRSDKPGHLFFIDEPLEFSILVDNFWGSQDRELTVQYKVRDYDNEVISHGEMPLTIKAKGKKSLPLPFSMKKKGIFSLSIDLEERGEHRGRKIVRFARLPHPDTSVPPEESFFGAISDVIWPDVAPWVEVMFRLGIRRPRFSASAELTWPALEPKQGEFHFQKLDKLVNLFRENGLAPWFVIELGMHRTPSWARGEETYVDTFGKKHRLPRDFSLVENFAYHLVDHFKDRVKYYEILNEPNLGVPDVKLARKFIKAAYKGAKRADPDCVVMGGSICNVSDYNISWLKKLLEEEEGYKYIDVVTFHNYSSGVRTGFGPHTRPVRPEDYHYAEKIEQVETMAKSYYPQPRLWNTETSWRTTYHGAFPHSQFFSYEKEYANTLVSAYLLSLSTSVEHFCWSPFQCFSLLNRKIGYMVRHRCYSFFDVADNVRPIGIAHANLASLFEGAKFKKKISFNLKEAYGLAFEKDGSPLIAVWSPYGDVVGEAKLPFEKLTFLDIMGNRKKIGSTLELTSQALYIVGNKGMKTEGLISSLEKVRFSFKHPLEIMDIIWSSRDEILVFLRNKGYKPLTLDNLSLEYDRKTLKQKGITIPAQRSQVVRFKLRERIKEKVLSVKVITRRGKETIQKEKMLLPAFGKAETAKLKAIKTRQAPSIDGDLEDWVKDYPIYLDKLEQVYCPSPVANRLWSGPEDLSCEAYLMWDDKYFYLGWEVTDNQHVNEHTGMAIWAGDSIEIGIDSLNDALPQDNYFNDNDFYIGLALANQGVEHFRLSFGNKLVSRDGPIPGTKLVIKREGKKKLTTYEMAIPFKELLPLIPSPGTTIAFNFSIDDDDGQGRKNWMELTLGLDAWGKKPWLYEDLVFLQ